MNILVTGSKGFVGKNLVENLKCIRDGKNHSRPNIMIQEIYEYDINTGMEQLEEYCRDTDFVFHFAGVNRPKEQSEFMDGNYGFSLKLLDTLKKHHNCCPIIFSSSIQANLTGRFVGSEYGKSKLNGELSFLRYAQETGNRVLIYRFPNIFGKWCKPNYNSVVATFCDAIANNKPYVVNDRNTQLELVYIDDLIDEMLDALEGKEHPCDLQVKQNTEDVRGYYCHVPKVFSVLLGDIVDLLESFKSVSSTYIIPEIRNESFAKRLYSTYISYLPNTSIVYDFLTNYDNRGSFTELIKSETGGQISVNITRPGCTKGQHWHNSKWEIFIVVSGHGLIQERKIGTDENGNPYPVHSFEVAGDKIKAVQMLPGYTHNISNLSETDDLITIMWSNEIFNSDYPDTFFEKVDLEKKKLS